MALTQFAGKVAGKRGRDETAPLFRQVLEAAGAALGAMTTDEHELSDELENRDESSEDDTSLPIKNYNAFSAPQLLGKVGNARPTATQRDSRLRADTPRPPNCYQPNQAT